MDTYDHAGNLSFAGVKAGLTFDPSVDGAHELPSAAPTVTRSTPRWPRRSHSWPSSPRLFDSTGAGDGVATASGSGGRALTWAGADASGETSCGVSSGGLLDRACFQLCSTVRSGGSAGANSTGLGRATEGARALSGLTGSGAASISGADGAASIGASSRAGASFITGSADVVAWSASGFTAPPHFRPPASA
jgi:hypothetical protein